MKKRLVHFPNNEAEIQTVLEPLLDYVLENDKKASFGNPEAFVSGWANKQIHIYKAEEAGQVVGVTFVLLVNDPVIAGKVHTIVSLHHGVDMKDYINTTLSVYGASI